MYCSQCGVEVNSDAKFCQSCGGVIQPSHSSAREILINQSDTFSVDLHPWRRFFARTVDQIILGTLGIFILICIYALIGGFIYYLFPQDFDGFLEGLGDSSITVFSSLFVLFWIPTVEAAFIATAGMTPGKLIFGISVLRVDGEKLSYRVALKRVFLVLIQGQGFYIPLVSIFTQLFAYRRLKKTATTLWDKSVGSVVTHKKWGVIRAIASVVVVFVTLLITKFLLTLE